MKEEGWLTRDKQKQTEADIPIQLSRGSKLYSLLGLFAALSLRVPLAPVLLSL